MTQTLSWLRAAVQDPSRRLPEFLPRRLDLGPAEREIRTVAANALPDTEIGGVLLLEPAGIALRLDLTWLAHYPPIVDGLPFFGTFHVHPAGMAPHFAPEDLSHLLRSDNPGFLDVLLAEGKLKTLVRTNPFLYVAAYRVDRDPLLFAGRHEESRRRLGPLERDDPDWARHYRSATFSLCHSFRLACYEESASGVLERVLSPS